MNPRPIDLRIAAAILRVTAGQTLTLDFPGAEKYSDDGLRSVIRYMETIAVFTWKRCPCKNRDCSAALAARGLPTACAVLRKALGSDRALETRAPLFLSAELGAVATYLEEAATSADIAQYLKPQSAPRKELS